MYLRKKASLIKGIALVAFWGQASLVMPQEVMLKGFQASTAVRSGGRMPGGAVFPENPQGAVFLPNSNTLAVAHNDGAGSISMLELDGPVLRKGSVIPTGVAGLGPIADSKEGFLFVAQNLPEGGFVYRVEFARPEPVRIESMGNFAHAGLTVGADGSVYLTEAGPSGGLFKYVPKGGTGFLEGELLALDAANRRWSKIEDPLHASDEARKRGFSTFQALQGVSSGPEEYIYFAEKGADPSFGRILRLNPRSLQVSVHLFGNGNDVAGPSALFWGSFLDLWVAEGKKGANLAPNKVLCALPSGAKVRKFAEVPGGEATGIAMDALGKTLYGIRQAKGGAGDVMAVQGDFRIQNVFTAETL
jgi:hypothetical protein